ncbi:MAG TPA: 50S ribosomal protein L4 [Armatimonadota bacterium]|nr:50S ribosomal protein L4 [Armatimonadota bacterium]
MPTFPQYNMEGTQTGEIELPDGVFGQEPNRALLHQTMVAALAARRQGTASAKTRSEVAGSTRKLWRQKGTGRARVGDRRPPHRVGGGVAMGPRPRSHRQRLPQAAKVEGLRSALSARAQSGDLIILESFELPAAKTKALQTILDALGVSGKTLLVLPEPNELIWRCGRNIPGLVIRPAVDVNILDVLLARKAVITRDAIPALEARLS